MTTSKVPSPLARPRPTVHVRVGARDRQTVRETTRATDPVRNPPKERDRFGDVHDLDVKDMFRSLTSPDRYFGTINFEAGVVDEEVLLLDIAIPSVGTELVDAVRRVAEQLPELIIDAQQESFEARARSLFHAYPLPDPLGDAHLDNYRKELQARQRYLKTVPCLTSKDVATAARHANKNVAQTAYRWKSEGKIFSIPAGGDREVYPAFQFKDGKPREVIAALLTHLAPARTPWEIARWFNAPNGWLDGDRPIDLLDEADARDLLLDAAEQEVLVNVG